MKFRNIEPMTKYFFRALSIVIMINYEKYVILTGFDWNSNAECNSDTTLTNV